MISSAYKLAAQILEDDYPSADWNIYPFHFSDGDNWSVDDTRSCISILKDVLVPASNQFSYGQVESPYGSGQFIKDLKETSRSMMSPATLCVRRLRIKTQSCSPLKNS